MGKAGHSRQRSAALLAAVAGSCIIPTTMASYRVNFGQQSISRPVCAFAESWLAIPELARLVEAAGGTWPVKGDPYVRLAALADFSDRWDFRAGRERYESEASPALPPLELIASAAASLGLTQVAAPSFTRYDHAIVLGGTSLSTVYRVKWLFDLMSSGIDVTNITGLTALRPLAEAELSATHDRPDLPVLLDHARTEFDVMTQAFASLWGADALVVTNVSKRPNLSSSRATIGSSTVIAAPSSDERRRANTRDNYAAYVADVDEGSSVLIVTNTIYVPYQFAVAVQALAPARPSVVEALGFPPEWMRGHLTQPHHILQEIRSAFLGFRDAVEREGHGAPTYHVA